MGRSYFNIVNWYAFSFTTWVVIMILNLSITSSLSSSLNNVTHINNNDPTYLDDYLYNYSTKSLPNEPETGTLYNITLPSNFSNMEVSILRLRSNKLWANGANYSYFKIPPKLIRIPYVRRLAIVYENLGNLSSHYYDLPGYTFLTKVIGFAVYNATDLKAPNRLNISLQEGKPIEVEFSQGLVLSSIQGKKKNNYNTDDDNKLKRCVTFDPVNGAVELATMLRPNVCSSYSVGHFALAMPRVNDTVPSPPHSSPSPVSPSRRRKRKNMTPLWAWWLVGFAAGIVGLMLMALCFVVGYKAVVSRKISRMEKTAADSESLGTTWIGNSKFPLAPVSRTQGVLENNFFP